MLNNSPDPWHWVRRIHSTYPIRTPRDLKGRKFAVSAKFLVEFFKSLGAIPISIPIASTAENITRGVIDGVLCDTNALYVFRINEVTSHYLKIPPLGCLSPTTFTLSPSATSF